MELYSRYCWLWAALFIKDDWIGLWSGMCSGTLIGCVEWAGYTTYLRILNLFKLYGNYNFLVSLIIIVIIITVLNIHHMIHNMVHSTTHRKILSSLSLNNPSTSANSIHEVTNILFINIRSNFHNFSQINIRLSLIFNQFSFPFFFQIPIYFMFWQ